MKNFALIGHPLLHSISPFIHEELFKLNNIEAKYTCIDISDKDLKKNLNILKKLDGYNITIPYKTEIIPFINKLSRNSFLSNSVNTVHNINEYSFGYTTDAEAFSLICEREGLNLKGDVVILGCGGVARAIALACIGEQAKSVTLAIRSQSKAKCESLVNEFETRLNYKINICNIENININIDLLVNGTPVGMYPDTESCPINEETIQKANSIFDTIYNPIETLLYKKAKAMNKKVFGGIEMLVYQAALAHGPWLNINYQINDLLEIIEKAKKEISKQYG